MNETRQSETIALGGGRFWCIETVYERARSVTAVESSYCAVVVAPQVATFKKTFADRVVTHRAECSGHGPTSPGSAIALSCRAMSSADALLAALASLREQFAITGRDNRSRRAQLDLLTAASDGDAATAIAADSDELGRMLGQVPQPWLDELGERPAVWLSGALTHLLTHPTSRPVRPLFDALGRLPPHPSALPVCELAMAAKPWRQVAAEHLLRSPYDGALETLLRHDGPDLDVRTRIEARLRQEPPPAWPDLAVFLGTALPPSVRREALRYLSTHERRPALPPPFVSLVEAYLDGGLEPAVCLGILHDQTDPATRRRLFARLWPIARSQHLPLPWPGIELWRLFSLLVHTAPTPDPLAVLLDELEQRDWSRALVQAIESRPDPLLAPAVARWTQGKPRSDVAAGETVFRACQAATPWPVLRPRADVSSPARSAARPHREDLGPGPGARPGPDPVPDPRRARRARRGRSLDSTACCRSSPPAPARASLVRARPRPSARPVPRRRTRGEAAPPPPGRAPQRRRPSPPVRPALAPRPGAHAARVVDRRDAR